MRYVSEILVSQWYTPRSWGWLLWPMLWPATQVFAWAVKLRRWCYQHKLLHSYKAQVPIIVVGNITVGGTGKTQLVMHLANMLRAQGYAPGIVTRGYKGMTKKPTLVLPNQDPKIVGDEAVLLAKRAQCPVVVARKRAAGAKLLAQQYNVNVIISDDGLQHYALERDIEIVMVDAQRRFGNGCNLPMGPLREPISRLKEVDLVIVHGQDMHVQLKHAYALLNPNHQVLLETFAGHTVHAIAGIGNPQRFFTQLRQYGMQIIEHAFPDHYAFKADDVEFGDHLPVLMTEKDAVKCRYFARSEHWIVAAEVQLSAACNAQLNTLINEVMQHG